MRSTRNGAKLLAVCVLVIPLPVSCLVGVSSNNAVARTEISSSSHAAVDKEYSDGGQVFHHHPSFSQAYQTIFPKKPVEGQYDSSEDTVDCPTGVQNLRPEKVLARITHGRVQAKGRTKAHSQDILFIISAPFSGSTALLSMISTSPEVSNLCAAKTWACEGTDVLRKAQLMTWEDRWSYNSPQSWSAALEAYGQYWDSSKSVLVDKSPPNLVKMKRIDQELRAEGLIPKFVVLAKNPCAMSEEYLPQWFDPLIDAMDSIPKEQVLLVKYEDLVRDPHNVAKKLLQFLPSLRSLDPNVCGICDMGSASSNIAYGGRNKSVVEYISTRADFDFSFYSVSSDWTRYMKVFGYA